MMKKTGGRKSRWLSLLKGQTYGILYTLRTYRGLLSKSRKKKGACMGWNGICGIDQNNCSKIHLSVKTCPNNSTISVNKFSFPLQQKLDTLLPQECLFRLIFWIAHLELFCRIFGQLATAKLMLQIRYNALIKWWDKRRIIILLVNRFQLVPDIEPF